MKNDREFDEILNKCIERVLRGEPVETCLKNYPGLADELRPLLQTALDTRKAAAITPRPEFRQRAAYEFQTAVRDLGQKRQGSFRWQVRLVTVLSVIVVILMAGTGTVAAANNSQPDQTLYPVKLATENVQVALTPSAVGKAELYAEFANRRVAEIVKMADEGKPEQVVKATERMNEQLSAIASLNLPAGEPMVSAEDTAAATPAALMAPEPSAAVTAAPSVLGAPPSVTSPSNLTVPAPETVSPQGKGQISVASNVSAPAATGRWENEATRTPVPTTAAPGVTSLPPTTTEEANKTETNKEAKDLKTTVSQQAEKNTQQLEDVLKRAPDNVKPALEKALEVAGNGYDKALKNMNKKK
jgi:hypothetical protein